MPAHRRHIRGTVQRSTRQNYDPGTTREVEGYSVTGKLLAETAWLPDRSGTLHKPAELTLTDLPETFNRDDELARWLNMTPALAAELDRDALLRAAGLAPEVVRLVQENSEIVEFLAKRPEVFERIRNEIESAAEDGDPGSTNFDYQAELAAAFSRPGREESDDDALDTNGQMPNPVRRRQKLQEEIRAGRGQEPDLNERFRRVPRKIWESKNSAVRTFFEAEYHGRCQICDFTFPERSGRWYFEGTYLVSHTRARWIDRPGNVLCLCANCCAQLVHGEVVADDLLKQIEGFRPSKEGGPISPSLNIVLCGRRTEVRFSERLLLDLQELVHASATTEGNFLSGVPHT